jgi:hypothetical protein
MYLGKQIMKTSFLPDRFSGSFFGEIAMKSSEQLC